MNMAELSKEGGLFLGKPGAEGSPFKNEKRSESLHDEAKQGVGVAGNDSDEAECSGRGPQEEVACMTGESPGKGLGPKKRKRGGAQVLILFSCSLFHFHTAANMCAAS